MSKMPMFALAAALAACGGATSLDQRSSSAVAEDRMAAFFSYDGSADLSAGEDAAVVVRRAAVAAISHDLRAKDLPRVFGCWYSVNYESVRWSCDSGLDDAALARAMLRVDPAVDQN